MAMEHNLTIIPVINKIDLPSADVERVIEQIDSELGLDAESHLQCSAKEGWGVEEILEAIVQRVPPPKGDPEAPLAALIFDAKYDPFRGTVIYCRMFDGTVKAGDIIRFMFNNATYKVEEVGRFLLKREKKDSLSAGEVGYIIAGVKTVSDVHTGDTITLDTRPREAPLPGFKQAKPVVFASIYPIASDDYEDLVASLEKYKLNDASFIFTKGLSAALGQGSGAAFWDSASGDRTGALERNTDLPDPVGPASVSLHLKRSVVTWTPHPHPGPLENAKSESPNPGHHDAPERYLGSGYEIVHRRRAAIP